MKRKTLCALVMVTCGMLSSPVLNAQQSADRSNNDQADRSQRSQRDQGNQQVSLPQPLQELDLKDDQKQEIRQVIQEHNQKLEDTYRQFHQAHARTIGLEAAWIAAVRDTLSEEDQQKYDDSRKKWHDKNRSQNSQDQQRGDQANRSDRQNRRSANRAVSQSRQTQDSESGDRQTANTRNRNNRQQNNRQQAGTESDNQSAHQDEFVVVTVTTPVVYVRGTQQTDDQMKQCNEACQEYSEEIVSAWKKTQDMHRELVRIEAAKIAAIEEVLTEQQLTQLRESRKQPNEDPSDESQDQASLDNN